MTDPIADMLTRIRNAVMVRHRKVRVPYSHLKERIAELLRDEGFISGFTVVTEAPRSWVEIDLRYDADDEPFMKGSKRVSRPGLRVYTRSREIPRVMGGIGVAVVSTSSGLMTGSEARRRKLGGEVLAFVW